MHNSAAGHTGAPSSTVAEGRLTKGGTGEVLDRFPGNTAVLAVLGWHAENFNTGVNYKQTKDNSDKENSFD